LLDFFNELKSLGSEFGYRTASEIYRFTGVMNQLSIDNEIPIDSNAIIDAVIMQKLLPKVHGSRRKLEPILTTLMGLCMVDKKDISSILNPSKDIDYTDADKIRFPISLEKIVSMNKRLIQNGFTSYAEA
jgi:5-methylcytosine-specific restriction protein B